MRSYLKSYSDVLISILLNFLPGSRQSLWVPAGTTHTLEYNEEMDSMEALLCWMRREIENVSSSKFEFVFLFYFLLFFF